MNNLLQTKPEQSIPNRKKNRLNNKHENKIQYNLTKAYASLKLFRTGPQTHPDKVIDKCCYSAKFRLDQDLRRLFPYINAVIEGTQYYSTPECVKFILDQHLCILYPEEGAFTPVENHAEAVDFLRILLAFIGDIGQRSNDIVPNFRKYSPASTVDIYRLLPGNNCQDCGYVSCMAFAAALSRQYTSMGKCPHFATPVEEKSTFHVVDKQGQKVQTISLDINTHCLHKQVNQKEAHIQTLQSQLTDFQESHARSFTEVNSRLLSPLTKREIEVLEKVAHGATNKDISKKLFVSEHTVKSHINHIFDKLQVNDRTQASVWATKNGLL